SAAGRWCCRFWWRRPRRLACRRSRYGSRLDRALSVLRLGPWSSPGWWMNATPGRPPAGVRFWVRLRRAQRDGLAPSAAARGGVVVGRGDLDQRRDGQRDERWPRDGQQLRAALGRLRDRREDGSVDDV